VQDSHAHRGRKNAPGFDRNGRTYTHRGAGGNAKIRIRVESGVGAVNIDLI